MMNLPLPVKISDPAFSEIVNIIQNKGIPSDYGLRIGVRGGGCSGVTHYLGFDKQKEKDEVYLHQGITIYIEKKDVMHLIGILVDYIDNDEETGFVFA